uniref:cysteine-rich receptor-like protein kinase 29 n=1 Tax=Fragaria vesca subsp. vesca TaxID=101020 RepID=UPI0005CA209D|nr:PREDICTED: cysteine-rich receptor-like protein kinase 29 [Fragaria vesca subsp. vesca]
MRPTQATESYQHIFDEYICIGSSYNSLTFGKNLDHLLSPLLSSSSDNAAATGFYSSSYGEIPDKVYAIGYCRGDLKPSACADCLASSTSLLLEYACANKKEGGVGSIDCTLRYSNISISGKRVDAPAIPIYKSNDKVSSSVELDFNKRLTKLFERLISEAAKGSGALKFAVGHSNAPVSSGITIYGLAQCSPDLSEEDCNGCLIKGLGLLPSCCYNSWTYYSASCSLRYDPYLFYDAASDPKPLPPPSPPPATTTNNSGGTESPTFRMVITTLVPIVVSICCLLNLIV